MTPSISIITPVWNGLPFVRQCIESAISQSMTDWEMVIGDNGSTDGTREYLQELTDPRIRVFNHQDNLGIFGNLNFLFKQARFPLSAILCADDYLLPEGLSKLQNAWDGCSHDVGFMRANIADIVNSRCRVVQLSRQRLPSTISPNESDLYFFLFGNIPGNLSNVSLRTHWVSEIGGFDQSLPYAGDFDFWSRLARYTAFRIEPIDVAFVRRHPGVASNYLNRKGELVLQNARVVKQLIDHLPATDQSRFIKLYATANYDTLQRAAAVRMWIGNRRSTYLKAVDFAADDCGIYYNWSLRWLVFAATGGGRWGRAALVNRILDASQNSQQKKSIDLIKTGRVTC